MSSGLRMESLMDRLKRIPPLSTSGKNHANLNRAPLNPILQVERDPLIAAPNGSTGGENSKTSTKTPATNRRKHKYTSNKRTPKASRGNSPEPAEQPALQRTKKQRPVFNRQWDIEPVCTIVRMPRFVDPLDLAKDCVICLERFRSERTFRSHIANAHGSTFRLDPLLDSDPRNEWIERQVFKLGMKQLPRGVPTFMIHITNKATVPVLLNSIYVFDGNVALLPVFAGKQVLRMVPGYCFEEEVTLDDLVLVDGRSYSLIISATPVVLDRVFKRQIVEQYLLTEKPTKSKGKKTQLKLRKLPELEIPRPIVILYKSNFQPNDCYTTQEHTIHNLVKLSQKPEMLTLSRYRRQVEVLNLLEAQHLIQEFFDYTVMNPVLKTDKPNSKLYIVSIDQFKKRPSLLNEEVKVKMVGEGLKVYGVIERMTEKQVTIMMQEVVDVKKVLKVMFIFNRSTFQLERQALDLLSVSLLQNICFPTAVTGSVSESFSNFEWIQPGIASNEEQKTAVRNIVNRTSFPAPYIIFGPPGTGKTSTLVEAIGQIFKLQPTANILVAASSNFAANELTSRLLNIVPEENIFRFFSYSAMRKMNDVDWDVLEVSNIAGRVYSNLCYEDIYMCRVVVATLTTAGRLVQADIVKKHFSYVFIDECGSSKEISSLIPIAGLATNGNEIHASIVLAGDPKQLGPVIQYDFLKGTSHNLSMLERMMNLPLYSRDPTTKSYNSLAITQLRDNFRSHDSLLQFCNNHFYEGQLRAKASDDIKRLAAGWHQLPNASCPLIFYPIVGKMKKETSTFSLMNKEEASQVMFYVGDLLKNGINGKPVAQTDIGIVSPYARQVQFLKTLCRSKKWDAVDIGSAEQYQGREKPIIIISTVRSDCESVGFLSDVKRLNVTLTRAQSLMIVVGNPETLSRDPLWKQFIEYCRANGAVAQPKSRKTHGAQPKNPSDGNKQKAASPKKQPANRNGKKQQISDAEKIRNIEAIQAMIETFYSLNVSQNLQPQQ